MKKKLYLYVIFYLCISSEYIFSQTLSIPIQNVEQCGANEIHKQMLLTDSFYAQRMQVFDNMEQNLQKITPTTTSVVYKIPVVIHVMHRGEPIGFGVNVSNTEIRRAMRALNEMYRKVPGSVGDGSGIDAQIEFVLAVRDPNGNCTDGINRVDMSNYTAYINNGVNRELAGGISDATLKSIISWDQTQYYNIWLVSEIDDNEGGTGIQGYAYFAASHGTLLDGAVIVASNFTSYGSTIAAHELGHSLNLYHTFEGDGTGTTCPSNPNGCGFGIGDCCSDIPAHIRSSSDCVSGSNACSSGTARDLFIHNYMDYSSSSCQNMLTADQKMRMHAALTGLRASFLGPENGGTCMSLVPVAATGVDFIASTSVLCGIGQAVTFTDISSCIPNSYITSSSYSGISHSWMITDGINTYTSSLQNPTITFTNSGRFNVTLSITNAFGSFSLTKTGMIVVTNGTTTTACVPNSNYADYYWQTIYNTTFNSINNSTSRYVNEAYSNLLCTNNTIVTSGNTYTMAISANAEGLIGNEVFEVYIDYNNDAIFNNPSELVFSGAATSGTSATFTTNITIPITAIQNTLLRMRVIGETSQIAFSERACNTNFYIGDVEDYGVYIIPASCTSPSITSTTSSSVCNSGIVTLSATSNTGTINWYPTTVGGTSIATGTMFTTPVLSTTTIYYVDATNAGCTTPFRTAITASVNPLPISVASLTNVSCYAQCNGGVSVIVNGGTSPYTYSINGASLSCQSENCTSLCAGNYTMIITDINGCLDSSVFLITEPQPLIVSVTNTASSCASCPNGKATANVSGGIAPFAYYWSPLGETTSTINNVLPGCYSVSITDSNNCESIASTCVGFVTSISPVSVNADNISLFPNPSNQFSFIKFNDQSHEELKFLKLTNIRGEEVEISYDYNNGCIRLNVSDIDNGMYFVFVVSNNITLQLKFIKQN